MARVRDPQSGDLLPEGITPVVSDRTGAVTYRIRVQYTDGTGRRRWRSPTFKTRAEAEAALYETRIALARGTYRHDAAPTVDAYWETWSARMLALERWQPSTYYNARVTWVRVFAPRIGRRRLDEVTRAMCQRLIDGLVAEGIAPRTVRAWMTLVSGLLRAAVRDGLIDVNPAHELTWPRERREPRPVWTAAQARAFLAGTADHPLHALWTFMLATGVRIGEATALHWPDLDLARATAHIRRTVALDADGKPRIRTGTKTESPRVVPVPAFALAVLERTPAVELVFHRAGELIPHYQVARDLARQARRLGLPHLTPHGLRHTAATIMLARGVPERVIQEILGHADIRTTMNQYVHVDLAMRRRGAAALGEALSDTTTEAPG